MPPATDFVHDAEIVDACLAVLQANLPDTWTQHLGTTTARDQRYGLRTLQFADLRDYRLEDAQRYADLCPAIMVRLNRTEFTQVALGGITGGQHPLRVLFLMHRDGCMSQTTGAKTTTARELADRAKTVSKALWKDASGNACRDWGKPTLTCADSEAHVVAGGVKPVALLYEGHEGDGLREYDIFGFAIDLTVQVDTQ